MLFFDSETSPKPAPRKSFSPRATDFRDGGGECETPVAAIMNTIKIHLIHHFNTMPPGIKNAYSSCYGAGLGSKLIIQVEGSLYVA